MKVTFSPVLNPYFFLSLDGITICPFVLILDVSMFYTVLLCFTSWIIYFINDPDLFLLIYPAGPDIIEDVIMLAEPGD